MANRSKAAVHALLMKEAAPKLASAHMVAIWIDEDFEAHWVMATYEHDELDVHAVVTLCGLPIGKYTPASKAIRHCDLCVDEFIGLMPNRCVLPVPA